MSMRYCHMGFPFPENKPAKTDEILAIFKDEPIEEALAALEWVHSLLHTAVIEATRKARKDLLREPITQLQI